MRRFLTYFNRSLLLLCRIAGKGTRTEERRSDKNTRIIQVRDSDNFDQSVNNSKGGEKLSDSKYILKR